LLYAPNASTTRSPELLLLTVTEPVVPGVPPSSAEVTVPVPPTLKYETDPPAKILPPVMVTVTVAVQGAGAGAQALDGLRRAHNSTFTLAKPR
jgi:hypothetical protein